MCVYLYIFLINASAYVPGTISSLRVQRTHIVASFSGSKVNKNLLCCAKGQEMCVCVPVCRLFNPFDKGRQKRKMEFASLCCSH